MTDCTCNQRKRSTITEKQSDGFKRTIMFDPAFVCERFLKDRNDPSNHGRGSLRLHFILRGLLGAVSFEVSMGAYIDYESGKVQGYTVTWHSRKKREYYYKSEEPCDWIGAGKKPCWSTTAYTIADTLTEPFLREGPESVWKRLRELYEEEFK